MSLTLKNIVVGFIKSHNKESFLKDGQKPDNIAIQFFSPFEALRLVDPYNREHDLSSGFIKSIQKHIGGGAAEFLRDIVQMPTDELLLTFEFHPENESEDLNTLKKLFRTHCVRQAKYFGSFAVEHLTLDHDHREEMPAVDF